MEIHAPAAHLLESMINDVKTRSVAAKPVAQFEDPIREFHRASRVEGLVRNWLTLSADQRMKNVVTFAYTPRYLGDPARQIEPESEQAFENRNLERWRSLMVIIQEETRALLYPKKFEHCAEAAITALKLAMPDHPWNKGK